MAHVWGNGKYCTLRPMKHIHGTNISYQNILLSCKLAKSKAIPSLPNSYTKYFKIKTSSRSLSYTINTYSFWVVLKIICPRAKCIKADKTTPLWQTRQQTIYGFNRGEQIYSFNLWICQWRIVSIVIICLVIKFANNHIKYLGIIIINFTASNFVSVYCALFFISFMVTQAIYNASIVSCVSNKPSFNKQWTSDVMPCNLFRVERWFPSQCRSLHYTKSAGSSAGNHRCARQSFRFVNYIPYILHINFLYLFV